MSFLLDLRAKSALGASPALLGVLQLDILHLARGSRMVIRRAHLKVFPLWDKNAQTAHLNDCGTCAVCVHLAKSK